MNKWTTGTSMAEAAGCPVGAAINRKIYCSDLSPNRILQIYDIDTDSWTVEATPFSSVYSAIGSKNCIYWMSAVGNTGGLHIYDTDAKSWSIGNANPYVNPGMFHGAVEYQKKLYYTGGTKSELRMLIYDIEDDSWSEEALPFPMSYHRAVVINDKMYCICGDDSSGITDRIYSYSFITRSWQTQLTPKPTKGNYIGCVAVNTDIHCIGGNLPSLEFNDYEIYNIYTDKWTSSDNMPTARTHIVCVYIDNKIYCIGGTRWEGKNNAIDTDVVEIYDLEKIIDPDPAPKTQGCFKIKMQIDTCSNNTLFKEVCGLIERSECNCSCDCSYNSCATK